MSEKDKSIGKISWVLLGQILSIGTKGGLGEGHMCMREFSIKFIKLSKYAQFMVADPRVRIRKFISGLSELKSKECKTTILVKEIEISCLKT